jgi:hypothetical protein
LISVPVEPKDKRHLPKVKVGQNCWTIRTRPLDKIVFAHRHSPVLIYH